MSPTQRRRPLGTILLVLVVAGPVAVQALRSGAGPAGAEGRPDPAKGSGARGTRADHPLPQPRPAPAPIPAHVPQPLAAVIERLLAKEPGEKMLEPVNAR